MLTIDDVIPFIGTTLDERAIAHLFGEPGVRFSDDLDPDHPEDQRHYYRITAFSLEMILGDRDTIETIFFLLRGKRAGYRWESRHGVGASSSRQNVLSAFGKPDRSAKPALGDEPGCVGFDQFRVGNALVHFEYAADCRSVRQITAMSLKAAPGGE